MKHTTRHLIRPASLLFVAHLTLSLPCGLAKAQQRDSDERERSRTKASRTSTFNPVFTRPHLQPSPYSLPPGRIIIGTDVAWGATSFLTLGTSLIRDLYGIYNLHAKVELFRTPGVAAALTMGWEYYNLRNISLSNPDLTVTSYQPGGVMAFALGSEVAWFLGGHFNISKVNAPAGSPVSSGYVQGAQVGSDLSFRYLGPTRESVGNFLAIGATWDFTWKLFGIGLSHHWDSFQLGVHFYPNAEDRKWVPVLSGSISF